MVLRVVSRNLPTHFIKSRMYFSTYMCGLIGNMLMVLNYNHNSIGFWITSAFLIAFNKRITKVCFVVCRYLCLLNGVEKFYFAFVEI